VYTDHILYIGDVSGHVTGTVSTTSSSSSATGNSIDSGESAANGSENDSWALYEVTVNCNLLNHHFARYTQSRRIKGIQRLQLLSCYVQCVGRQSYC
jgi:hypothetical protein